MGSADSNSDTTTTHTHRMIAPLAPPERVGAKAGNRRLTEQGKRQATNLKIHEEICGKSKNVER